MTSVSEQTFTTENMQFLRNEKGIDTVRILVKNGIFVVSMDDLLRLVGAAREFTLKAYGDELEISASGVVLTMLYLSA